VVLLVPAYLRAHRALGRQPIAPLDRVGATPVPVPVEGPTDGSMVVDAVVPLPAGGGAADGRSEDGRSEGGRSEGGRSADDGAAAGPGVPSPVGGADDALRRRDDVPAT
jgi:hypothetical protein